MDECLYFIVLFSFGVEFVICLLLLLLLLLTYRTGSDKYFHNKIPIDVYSCPFCPNLILQRFFGGGAAVVEAPPTRQSCRWRIWNYY